MIETDLPDTIVFDAEPLIAYFCDEPGSDTVERYVEAAEGRADGYVSTVTTPSTFRSSGSGPIPRDGPTGNGP